MNSILTDKVALVTGASRGLGKAIALALAAEGASIAAVARSEEALKETVEAIRTSRPPSKKSPLVFRISTFWSTTPASRATACSCA
jgi:NAD(P)-dependent dehydrogenase (short-subunit alcohol dehydrogenase family)